MFRDLCSWTNENNVYYIVEVSSLVQYMSNFIELQYWGMAKFSWTYIESPTLYSMHITSFMCIMNNFLSDCKNKNESALQKQTNDDFKKIKWSLIFTCFPHQSKQFGSVFLNWSIFAVVFAKRKKNDLWLLIFFSFYNYNKVKFHIDIDVIELEIQFTFSLVQSLLYG